MRTSIDVCISRNVLSATRNNLRENQRMAEIEMISSRNILVLMINLLFVKSGFVPKEKMKKTDALGVHCEKVPPDLRVPASLL